MVSVGQEMVQSSQPTQPDLTVRRKIDTLLSKPGGNMFELPDGHTLVVTDYKTVVDALLQLQEYVDTPRYQQHWKIYRLKNVPVGEIIDELKVLVEQTIVISGKQDADGIGLF